MLTQNNNTLMEEKYQDMWGDLKSMLIQKDLLDEAYWEAIEFVENFYHVGEQQGEFTRRLKEQIAWKKEVGLL